MILVNSNNNDTICRSDVIGEWEGTICPICRERECFDMAVCEAEYDDVEDTFLRMDEKEALDKFKAMW